MPTELQKAAVEKLVESGGKSVSKAMRESRIPYSPKTAKNPKKLTESNGFKELLKKYGLTEGLITKSLVADIKKKPQRRVKELGLGADILRMRDQKPSGDTYNQFNFFDAEQLKRIAGRIQNGDSASEE